MWLDLFRRQKSVLKYFLWFVIITLSAGMLLLFVSTPTGVRSGLGSREVASVDGQPISVAEYRQQYDQMLRIYRQIYKQQDSKFFKKMGLGQMALKQLISSYAILTEADRLGITVTPEEIYNQILSYPAFKQGGKFVGKERYQQILTANNMTPQQFEQDIRNELLRQKLQAILTDGIRPTSDEIRQKFLDQNQQAKVRYVAFNRTALPSPQVPDKDLKAYFDQHKAQYKSQEKRKVKYVMVTVKPTDVSVTPQEIQQSMPHGQKPEMIRASQILIAPKKGETTEAARKRAEGILTQLRAGSDFAQTAKKYSDDASSRDKGGDLGFFGKGKLPAAVEEVAFSLHKGEISQLVQAPDGFHILKLTDIQRTGQEAAVEQQLRQEKADREARNRANRVDHDLKTGSTLEQVAQKYQLKVQETPLFGLGDTLPQLPVRSDFNQTVFSLQKGALTDPYVIRNGELVIAQLDEIKAPEQLQFADVRDQVIKDYRKDKAEETARKSAFDFYDALKDGKASFEKMAAQKHLKVSTTKFFKKGANVDNILKFSPKVQDEAFSLPEGGVSSPVVVADNYVVIQVVDRTPFDEEKFKKEKDSISQQLAMQKRNQFFTSYVQNLVNRLQKEDRIQINQQLLDSVEG